jgi:quercetin dioxygenase-like cupin family protein
MLHYKKAGGAVVLTAIALLPTVRADGATPSTSVAAPPAVLNVTTDAMPKTPNADVWVLALTIPPGSASIWHTHPTPPFVYVESGTGTWEYRGGRPQDVRHAGQAIMEPANVVMRIANNGTTPLSLVIFQVTKPGEPRIHSQR